MADHYTRQLPDIDPVETTEWIQSLDAIVAAQGKVRARYLVAKLLERANELQVGVPPTTSTPYINTIPAEEQSFFPGDEDVERRIRAFIRWNAAAMVIRANKTADGIGGHLSTFASSASLYEVGFNHFFKGKESGLAGDHVYFQGHAAPGVYARAFMEGRLTETQLDNFRMEVGGNGLSSYPHPRLMPEFWEFPTVSMGLGPINSIYHARFNKYLHQRHIEDTSASTIWSFLGDGECDEPETLGAISLAGRSDLDNLKWVINCNLQRLDGPVRGNDKIIQELEGVFRGAGWNVIKVVWGTKWDELLQRDVDGVLLNRMNTTVDGEYQRYAVEDGAYIREHFFGPDPRLRQLVEHLSDDDLRELPRGGHDYQKVYAAFKAAAEVKGQPTVILAKTVKGWTLGEGFEGRNSTHQIKKMTKAQLLELRERLHMQEEIPEESLEDGVPPYYRPETDSVEHEYMVERRKGLDGAIPTRVVRDRRPLTLPSDAPFIDLQKGSSGREVSTTMAFTALLRDLLRDQNFGERVVPIVPDEARTFGMDSLFREFKIYAPEVNSMSPSTMSFCCRTPSRPTARSWRRASPKPARPPVGWPPARLTPTPACRWFPSSASTRCSGSSGSATCSGPRPMPAAGDFSWVQPPAGPPCWVRDSSTRTATVSYWHRPFRPAMPTTRPSHTSWQRSSTTAFTGCIRPGLPTVKTSSTTSRSTTRTTSSRHAPIT